MINNVLGFIAVSFFVVAFPLISCVNPLVGILLLFLAGVTGFTASKPLKVESREMPLDD